MSRHDWMDDALCAQIGPALFFPTKKGVRSGPAKAICARCPVQEQCLKAALGFGTEVTYGIWGNTTHHERRRNRATPEPAQTDPAHALDHDQGTAAA